MGIKKEKKIEKPKEKGNRIKKEKKEDGKGWRSRNVEEKMNMERK